jgi:predicted DNA-binding transcriptional regulator YafY
MGDYLMVLDLLREAIKDRKRVAIVYDGATRIIDPYLVGINEKGNVVLRAHQVGGYSKSGRIPTWRLYLIDEVQSAHLLDEHFDINELYNPNDKAMERILFRVEP